MGRKERPRVIWPGRKPALISHHLYTMSDKHNLHKQAKKRHKNLRKVLSEGHTQAIHKYKNTSKSASSSGESLVKFGL